MWGFSSQALRTFIFKTVQLLITTHGYDARGNRTSVIDPMNGSAHSTIFAYDLMNRLTGITYPDGSTGRLHLRRTRTPDSTAMESVYDLAGKVRQLAALRRTALPSANWRGLSSAD